MKKNKFIVFYSIFASITILFALCYLGYNLYSEYSHGYERTKRRFEHVVKSIQKITDQTYNSKREFNIELDKIIGETNDFSYIEIKENGAIIYAYPEIESISESTNLIKNYYDYFRVNDKMIYISANLYILRPASIAYYSKISLLIILIITLLTLICVIYFNVNDPDKPKSIQPVVNEPVFTDEKNVFETALEKSDSEEIPATEEKVDLPYKEFEPAKIDTLSGDSNGPSGLFNPVTGLGWESYLKTRLDNELNRAISSEFDLALFIIQIPDLVRENEKIKKICDYLIEQFQFKDLLFEYKNDSIVGIKINMTLEQALTLSDKLYVDIKNIIGGNNTCYIGISTRTIRMVSSERLLKEAEEALNHAHEDPENPIIAFRANADKYRQFLETQN